MIKPKLTEMTLREKIGQCLLVYQWDIYDKVEVGYDYSKSDEDKVRALHEKEGFGTLYGEQVGIFYASADSGEEHALDISENGDLKVFSAPYKKFIDKQGSYLKIPPLVAVDCERGTSRIFEDGSDVCNGAAIGAADDDALTYKFGASIARELRAGGINWRWYPVTDIGSRNSAATGRSIAFDDNERMIRLSKALIKGMQSEGVAACVKHFPGYDRFDGRDSHFTASLNSNTVEEWWAEQGRIFKDIISDGVYSVMISHTAFPAADDTMINGKYVPSTLSKKIITDLLKKEIGFDGVVITDGITMAALFSLLPYEELIVGLINAGNDVILGAKLESGDIIEKAVLDGRIPMERIDDACQRVLDMKEKIGLFKDDYNDIPYTMADTAPVTKKINSEIADKSMTLVRDRHNALPIDKSKIKKVSVIVSSHSDKFIDELGTLKEEFEKRGAEVYMQRRLKNTAEIKEISETSDLIIYAAFVEGHIPKGEMRLFGEECETFYYAFNHGKEKSIGVSFGYPYIHYDIMENADVFINAYNKSPEAQKAFVKAIFGEIEITGKSPVLLIPRAISR